MGEAYQTPENFSYMGVCAKFVSATNGKPRFGSWKDRITVDDSFLERLPEEEPAAWEGS